MHMSNDQKELINEINKLKKNTSDHIVKYIDHFENNNLFCIVMELFEVCIETEIFLI